MNTPSNTPAPQIILNPIGIVQNAVKTPMLTAKNSGLSLGLGMEKVKEHRKEVEESISKLVIDTRYEELLDGIEDFSHILVLYWPHLIEPERRSLKKVHPMGRKDLPLQGIYATCSPARPNPILVTTVALKNRAGNILTVQGLDAVDGSPVIDIKPFHQSYMQVKGLKSPAWMEQINKELQEK